MFSRVLVVLVVVACLVHRGDSRSVILQDNDVKPVPEAIPKVHVGADGVSASFGGYSASAGLGGSLGGGPAGGLYARAGTPGGTGASAGLGGSLGGQPEGALFAGAGVGGGPGAGAGVGGSSHGTNGHKIRPGTTLYNDIFNIPTSILGAVNRLLNGGVAAVSNAGAEVGTAINKPGVGVHAQAGASAGTGGTGGGIRTSTGLFNDIFNIPITALNAVNQLLNNKTNGK